jgi:hypothetical protein
MPILFWPTEIYSFGKCYRDWLGVSKLLPIPFYGDHGVTLSNSLSNHEVNNNSNYHFTWNKYRFENHNNHKSKKLIYITNPWVIYRRKNNINLKYNRKGTIVFYSHTNIGIDFENENHDEYFIELNKLGSEFKPLVICIHMHDINKGLHKKLRKYGFPLITIGNSLNTNFIDRFYETISNFKQGTSNIIGSQLFYCTEIGLPYFLYGDQPVLINKSDENIPLGKMRNYDNLSEFLTNEIKNNFSKFSPKISNEQQNIITPLLGLDSINNKQKILSLYKIEILSQFPYYLKIIFMILIKKIKNAK